MPKTAGLGCALYAGGYDIGGDTQSFVISGGPATGDVTDITQSATARLGLLRDGGINWVSYFDTAAGASHAALSPLPTADEIVTAFMPTLAIGSPAAALNAKQLNYDGTRAADGMLTFALQDQGSGFGLEWGVALTAGKRTDTTATAGSPYDQGGAGPGFGAQAYLHVFSFAGTDATVKIQDATTSGGTYADVTGLTFSQVTSNTPSAQRLATASNLVVREFVKVTTVTTGGFSSLVFAVMLSVNPVAVVF